MRLQTRFLLALCLATALAVTGCAGGVKAPAEAPAMHARIASISFGGDTEAVEGVLGSLQLEAVSGGPASQVDRAMVTITDSTAVLTKDTKGKLAKGKFEDLAERQVLDVWFTGPVAESYPVQATAATIVIQP